MGYLARGVAALLLLFPLAGCGNRTVEAKRLTSLTIAMGYIADVQFAPFYVAQAKGYYRQAGLDVHLRYGIEPDLLRLASAGKVDFVNSGGDEVLSAGAHGLRVTYVLTQYTRFPSALFTLQQSGIRQIRDLKGKTIGIPGAYGASYVGLLALLNKAGLSPSQVSIRSIQFTQRQAVAHHRVDAAVGFANNEPVFLRQQGYKIREFDIYRYVNLAGAGIAVGNAYLKAHPATVRGFVHATIQGMRETLRHPSQAFTYAEQAVPDIRVNSKGPRAVLQRSLDFWRAAPGRPLGWVDPSVWSTTAVLLYRSKQISHPVNASSYYTNRFVLR